MATDEALKRKLISRTARVWGRLNKRLIKELNKITQEWIHKLIWHAEREVASGDISNVPEFPEIFTKILQQGLREAFAYGYWLQELYLYERRGRKYKGKITLAEGDIVKDLLENFMVTGEWNDIVPEDAVNWVKNYIPKLAGVLNQDVLEATRNVIQQSLLEGATLQERMKALRVAAPELANMANRRIEAIARTEITRADSLGRIASAKTNDDVVGFEFSAIMDDRTTEICASRHGLVMRIDDPRLSENTPPCHVNCRSVLLSLTIYDYPDGLLTSHEFDEIPPAMQRPEDIAEVEKLLEFEKAIEEAVEEKVQGVSQSIIDGLRGFRGHKDSLSSQDVSDDYNRVGIKLSDDECQKRMLALMDFTGTGYEYMRDAFLRNLEGEKLSQNEENYLKKYNLCDEYTKVAPTYQGNGTEIYRGINPGIYADKLIALKIGDTFDLQMPSSFSSDRMIAFSFSGSGGIMLHVQDTDLKNSVSIKGYSKYTSEEEILVNDKLWDVVNIDDQRYSGLPSFTNMKDGRYHITLKRKE